jgi:hypothetical protein
LRYADSGKVYTNHRPDVTGGRSNRPARP